MEVSGVVLHQISGACFQTHNSKLCFSALLNDAGNRSSGELRLLGSRDKRVSVEPKKFSEYGHLKTEKKNTEIATKKKLKLLKGLSRDLLMFTSMGFGVEVAEDSLIGVANGKKVSEAAEVLLAQLQQLREEEKEMKRKRKEEKAKVKAEQKRIGVGCESSSSFSESSDNECRQVVNISRLRNGVVGERKEDEPQEAIPEKVTPTSPSLLIQKQNIMQVEAVEDCSILNCGQDCCTESTITNNRESSTGERSVAVGALNERIEVCMGGKCKKSGAVVLLEEFQRRVGREGAAVVGCKCMGKCKDGPNVRILNQCSVNVTEKVDDSVRLPTNPLFIGVGMEDVGVIVANFFGEEGKDLGLMVA